MQFIQKKGSNKHTFLFKDETLNFAYKDKSGSGDTDVYYGNIPRKSIIKIEQNDWLKNAGFLWLIIGVFQIFLGLYVGSFKPGDAFWFVIGGICLSWFYLSKIKYTVFSNRKWKSICHSGKPA